MKQERAKDEQRSTTLAAIHLVVALLLVVANELNRADEDHEGDVFSRWSRLQCPAFGNVEKISRTRNPPILDPTSPLQIALSTRH